MLAKAIRNRKPMHDAQQDFGARVAYVCAKAEVVELANLAGDWRDAAFQMRISSGLAPRTRSPVYHFVLAWAETEQPTDTEIINAAHQAIRGLGASEHQYVIAIHRNRVNTHAHVVLNKVHPITGTTWSASHDFARLEHACRQIEHQMGWPQDRGRFDIALNDDRIRLIPKPAAHWQRKTTDRERGLRPDSRAVRGYEKRSGLPSLRDAIRADVLDQIRTLLDAAKGWQDVHSSLGQNGLRYVLYGAGARIARVGGEWFMAACQLGAAYGLRRLRARLGGFEPAQEQELASSPLALSESFNIPMHHGGITDTPLPLILKGIAKQMQDIRRSREARRTERRTLAARQDGEARQLRQALDGKRSTFEQALRAVMHETHREQITTGKRRGPASDILTFDATADLIRLAPGGIALRRYRHVLRRGAAAIGSEPDDLQMDHTGQRQAWVLAASRANPQLPDSAKSITDRYSQDLRADGSDRLLLARRNYSGGITGFDVLPVTNVSPSIQVTQGNGQGLGLIGPRNSTTCVIVPDIAAGLMQAALSDDAQELIVVIGHNICSRSEAQLRVLSESRMTFVAFGPSQEHAENAEKLRRILPGARWRKRNPGDLWHRFIAGQALGPVEPDQDEGPAAL